MLSDDKIENAINLINSKTSVLDRNHRYYLVYCTPINQNYTEFIGYKIIHSFLDRNARLIKDLVYDIDTELIPNNNKPYVKYSKDPYFRDYSSLESLVRKPESIVLGLVVSFSSDYVSIQERHFDVNIELKTDVIKTVYDLESLRNVLSSPEYFI